MAETQAPHSTRVEIHSNFSVSGSKTVEDGLLPPNHAEHERLELTQGINDWAEVGFIFSRAFSPMADGGGWVTTSPARVHAPEKWHWPVGVSLSTEFGYQRAAFSPDNWAWEIRPIVDRKIGPWYLAFSFSPALDRWSHGPGVNQGVTFSPTQRSATTSRRRLPADWNTTRPMVRYPTSPLSEISSSNSSPRSTSISLQNGSLTLESE